MECLDWRSRRHGITATGFDPFGVGTAIGTNRERPAKCNNRRRKKALAAGHPPDFWGPMVRFRSDQKSDSPREFV